MQKITNIEIKNFKSIRNAEVKNCRRVNVFVGYPNVGKSNILEALSLYALDSTSNFSNFIRVKEDPTLFYDGSIGNDIEVIIDDFRTVCKYENNELTVSLWLSSVDKLNEHQRMFVRPGQVAVLLQQLNYRNFNKNGSSFPNDQIGINQLKVRKYEFKKNVFVKGNNYSFLDFPFGENIFNILRVNDAINKSASELFENYNLEFSYDSRVQEFTILKRTNKGIFTVPYELLADTLQRLIFHKAAILSNNETVLLFEEPEAHMFTPYIAKFTSDIIHDKNDNQYFIATHSPYVLNDFMEELKEDELSVFAVFLENGETKIKKLTDKQVTEIYQYGIDFFFNLESFLKND